MNRPLAYHHLIPALASGLLLCTTSCASLFGNPNCHCTHPGPCVCCDQDQSGRVVVAHRPVQQDSTVDKSFLKELLSKDYSLHEYLPEEPKRLVWVDEPVTATLTELQNSVKQSGGWTMPRDVTTDNTENALYFYFTERADGTPDQLRLRVQYYADDPLRFNDIQFTIDGFDYSYRAASPRRGKGTGRMIWEESDQAVASTDKDLLYALSHAHWVRMSLVGADGTKHVKMLTETQIQDFYSILQLYRLLGGRLD